MLRLTVILVMISAALFSYGAAFSYKFHNTPLSEALSRISKEHPDISLIFIYNELENYATDAYLNTDDPQEALRQVIGLNPITVSQKANTFFLEALQHGKYVYTGRITGIDNEPVVAATVILLQPKDSTAITYGITATDGRFSIPCDRKGVIAKVSSTGYQTIYVNCKDFNVGIIRMKEQPVSLQTVNVSLDRVSVQADRTVFIPTTRQKNASQTGIELVRRMAIPYLRATGLGDLTTVSGAEVDIFIDFLPATGDDLKGMKMADVRKVEYYDFPSDPRFLGKQHVVNFIMTKYEYGGYLKGYTDHNIFYNSGQLNGYGKLQYKKMTYDVSLGGYHRDDDHAGTVSEETFRIPDSEGEVATFKRHSDVESSDVKGRLYWSTFRATYATEKLIIRNSIAGDFDHKPTNAQFGSVSYSPEVLTATSYSSNTSNIVNSLSYYGNFSIFLPKNNTITIFPDYSYSHTNRLSDYSEEATEIRDSYSNLAKDDTHRVALSLGYTHRFKNRSNLRVNLDGSIISDNITYTGTSDANDKTHSAHLQPSIAYSLSLGNFYGAATAGMSWERFAYNNLTDHSIAPRASVSLQYSFLNKHSLRADFNYNSTLPAAHYRSDNIIQSNPLMSYTGNPLLKPEKKFSINGSYTFFPSDMLSGSVYTFNNIISNRAVFDYLPIPNGILRTITQASGRFSQSTYGAFLSVNLFENNLQLGGTLEYSITRNGAPYNWTKSTFDYYFEAYYYLKSFNFGGTFISPSRRCPDPMSGSWSRSRAIYYLEAGWANKAWNLRVLFNGFANYNWKNETVTLHTPYYDQKQTIYGSGHFFIKLSATYTFGFGKKVQRGDESDRMKGVNSNILQ
ncbi:MAG: TonB-dependent receptor family protein [Muribaculaceae bacterium]|nr:TonB-dependent receptor family protein [Muribaculaceae bacterium]